VRPRCQTPKELLLLAAINATAMVHATRRRPTDLGDLQELGANRSVLARVLPAAAALTKYRKTIAALGSVNVMQGVDTFFDLIARVFNLKA